MRLRTKNIYVYYDFPVVFSATDEAGNVFICLFADETDSHLKYFCREITYFTLMDLESNKKDIRSIFTSPGKLYCFYLNSQSEEPVDAVETFEDIASFLPDEDFFIGIQKNEIPQTIKEARYDGAQALFELIKTGKTPEEAMTLLYSSY